MLVAGRQPSQMHGCWRINSLEINRDKNQCKGNSEARGVECSGILSLEGPACVWRGGPRRGGVGN